LEQGFLPVLAPARGCKESLMVPRQILDRGEVQKVATLVHEKQKTAYKTARWDASSFSSGIYFYQLQAGDFVQTRKMVVLK